ncbi:MAG: hypothetical protein ACK4S4_15885 [Pyrinomonadaceae bacterium]
MRQIVNKIRRPTLGSVLSGFKRTIADLEAVEAESLRLSDRNSRRISDHYASINELSDRNAELRKEAASARSIAQKISELISA